MAGINHAKHLHTMTRITTLPVTAIALAFSPCVAAAFAADPMPGVLHFDEWLPLSVGTPAALGPGRLLIACRGAA